MVSKLLEGGGGTAVVWHPVCLGIACAQSTCSLSLCMSERTNQMALLPVTDAPSLGNPNIPVVLAPVVSVDAINRASLSAPR